jgi:hypothetical protein
MFQRLVESRKSSSVEQRSRNLDQHSYFGVATMEYETKGEGRWFLDILARLSPNAENIEVQGTPEDMIQDAAKAAFRISAAAGAVPGAFGMAAIVPEVAAISRLQIMLLHRIAAYYRKPEIVNQQFILLIFANVLGVAAGESFVKKAGATLVLKAMTSDFARRLAQKVGIELLTKAAEKSVLRWIPVVTAPVFGFFSRSMTLKIGKEADFFFRCLEIEPA